MRCIEPRRALSSPSIHVQRTAQTPPLAGFRPTEQHGIGGRPSRLPLLPPGLSRNMETLRRPVSVVFIASAFHSELGIIFRDKTFHRILRDPRREQNFIPPRTAAAIAELSPFRGVTAGAAVRVRRLHSGDKILHHRAALRRYRRPMFLSAMTSSRYGTSTTPKSPFAAPLPARNASLLCRRASQIPRNSGIQG